MALNEASALQTKSFIRPTSNTALKGFFYFSKEKYILYLISYCSRIQGSFQGLTMVNNLEFLPQTTKELIIDDKVEQLVSDENSVQVSYER